MRHARSAVSTVLFAFVFGAGLAAQSGPDGGGSTAISPVSASLAAAGSEVQVYQQHVTTLADPFFEGRAPGFRGNRLAAEYIEFHFKRAGLEPAFKDEGSGFTYRQPFPVGVTLKVTERQASFAATGDDAQPLTPLKDFTVHEYSASGRAEGPVVFVGYSVAEGQDGYATYPPLEESRDLLKGKIALVLRFEPMKADGHSRWADDGWSLNADLSGKLNGAAERGASAIILVSPANAADPRAGEVRDADGARAGGFPRKIPIVMMTPAAADRLVRAGDPAHRSLADMQREADERGVVVDLPDVRATIAAGLEESPTMTDNVGAVLKGKGDLAGQYVVIGAHYDHVGYGFGGRGALHPGADDNASGTSGVLLMADLLKKDYETLPEGASARSVLFLCFSAEEMGLIGSRYYAQNPTVAPEAMHLMLNMDMIGRLRDDHLEVGGQGTGEGLDAFLAPYLEASGLTISESSVGDDRSDHASFRDIGVPGLFFFTGLHEDYHAPGDVAWKINPEGAVRVVRLVKDIALGAAQRREQIAFTGRRTPKVMLGIMPGGPDPAGGVTIGGVIGGFGAAEAGLEEGDRIVKIGGKEVPDFQHLAGVLADFSPGDTAEVVYVRAGEEHSATVTLQARRGG